VEDQELLRTAVPIRQADPPRNSVYIWKRIDPRKNRLVRNKLLLAGTQLRQEIANEITISRKWEQKVDDHAGECYDILCRHWNLLGETKTGAFVRVALDILLPRIKQLGSSAAYAASQAHCRRGSLGMSTAGSYEISARAICNRWRTKLDIEAGELDLVAALAVRSVPDFHPTDRSRGADNPNRVGFPTTQPLTAVAGHKPNHVTIHVASFMMQYPAGQVAYSSGAISGLLDSTLYYVYCDDPHHRGGAQTYLVSTKESDLFAAEGRAYIGTIATPGIVITKAVHENTAYGLGEWADNRLPEFQHLVRLLRSGGSPKGLKEQFSLLFSEVIDHLQPTRQERLFKEARGGLTRVPDLMGLLAEIKHLSGATLTDYRKQYRRETRTARSPRSAAAKI
jgi:hypothetical protein